jgi:hypothetical protein
MKELRLRADAVEWREIEGEVVALATSTSTYVTANRTGAVLWQALAEGATHEALVSRLVDAWGVDPETARADVDDFLSALQAHGLLED